MVSDGQQKAVAWSVVVNRSVLSDGSVANKISA